MLLTDAEIRQANVIHRGSDARYGSTSYDLAVQTIIDSEGEVFGAEGYTIKPQEIVWVISKERIVLPSDITGHAVIRTSLCNYGLLALNIGIVDPGWDGPIATAMINFSSSKFYLSEGEKFLRLSFYKHLQPEKVKSVKFTDHAYLQERKKRAIETFGSTFLDVDDLTRRVRDTFIGTWKEKIIFWSALSAVIFGFMSIMIAVSTYLLPWNGAYYQKNYEELQNRVNALELRLKQISTQKMPADSK